MITNPEQLITDFIEIARISGIEISKTDIEHEVLTTPHRSKSLPIGKQAVYIFSIGSDRPVFLKVGKVGPNSNARFNSQHYHPGRSMSNLANSLLNAREQWESFGISELDSESVGPWLKEHTDIDHFYLADSLGKYPLSLLEIFIQCRLKPMFEG